MTDGRGFGRRISVVGLWRLRQQDGGGRKALASASGRVGVKAEVVWEESEAIDEPCPTFPIQLAISLLEVAADGRKALGRVSGDYVIRIRT
jgi:hypothetical protein